MFRSKLNVKGVLAVRLPIIELFLRDRFILRHQLLVKATIVKLVITEAVSHSLSKFFSFLAARLLLACSACLISIA